MSETPFIETEVLLRILEDNRNAALGLLTQMLPGERRAFWEALGRLAEIMDPASWCPSCLRFVERRAGSTWVGRPGGPTQAWHQACYDVAETRAERRLGPAAKIFGGFPDSC